MAALSAKLRSVEFGTAGSRIAFWCPGCDRAHLLQVRTAAREVPSWEFDGNIDAPTFAPSILVTYDGSDAGIDGAPPARCHSFVRAGVIEFLGDCAHKLKGQHVPLPDFPTGRD